jgi:hypothetical protein
LLFIGSGNDNTAIGYKALNMQSGNNNTAIGSQALLNNQGFENIAIGAGAGLNSLAGSKNILIGYMAEWGTTNLTNAIAIGEHAVVSNSNTIQLGNSSITDIYAGVNDLGNLHSGYGIFEKSVTVDKKNFNNGFNFGLYFGNTKYRRNCQHQNHWFKSEWVRFLYQ